MFKQPKIPHTKLSEKDDKIRDVEGQINQLQDWVQEDQDKLDGWN